MPDYPPAERLDIVEDLHGIQVADPYRWLEDDADPRTVAWSAAQDELARAHLEALPGRDHLLARLSHLLSAGVVGPPTWRGERAFFLRREPGQEHPCLILREADGAERTLLDPGALDPTGLTTLDAWSVSIEGDKLAYQLSVGGDEESLLRVIDVDSGELLDGPTDRCRYSPVAWLPGGARYYYVRRLPPEQVPPDERDLHRRVYLHQLGSDVATDVEVFGADRDKTSFYGVHVDRGGNWLLISASTGTAPSDDVWIADLAGDGELREVQVGVDARTSAWIGGDGQLYLYTDRDAPRRRLCVTDPRDPDYGNWRDVVPESPDTVLSNVALVASAEGAPDVDLVVAAHVRDACGEISVYDARGGGRVATVDRYRDGTITALVTRPEGGRECWIGYTDHATPAMVLAWSADTPGEAVPWATAPGAPEVSDLHVTRVHYPSKDGTEVHLFVMSAQGLPDTPRPAILYGYGGFNISLTPDYNPMMLAWVRAGGVYAVANLRGGSEHGEQWHRAGRRERKQNVFDDYAAAAEYLIAEGWTSPDRLGLFGGSNGGLLVGAALTQRPELYSAVVCSKPLLDMVRYELSGLGPLWTDEYGTAERAEEFAWLFGYSPYHRVRDGVAYPAVLFTTFESDTRVAPLHARKMCALLQHASTGGPVILRRELGVGHAARSVTRSALLITDQLGFLADQLGLPLVQ